MTLKHAKNSDSQPVDSALLQLALGSMQDAVALWGKDERLLFCNPRYTELFGRAAHLVRPGVCYPELLRAYVDQEKERAWLQPDPEIWYADRLARFRNPGEPFEAERSAGWFRFWEVRLSSGELLVQAANITESKQAADARWYHLVNEAADAVYVHDESGQIVEVNSEACRETGYRREELLSMYVSDLDVFYGKRAAEIREIWNNLRASKQITLGSEHRRKDGSIFPVEVRVRSFQEGERIYYIAIARNVGDRESVGEELTRVRQMLSDAIESIGDGFLMLDDHDRLIMWNEHYAGSHPALQRLLRSGFPFADLVRRLAAEGFYCLGDRDVEALVQERLVAHHNIEPYEYQTSNGRWYRMQEYPTATGGRILLRMDVTDTREMEQRLLQAQKLTAVGQLAGGIAHDFNNLLQVLIGNLDILQLKMQGSDVLIKFVESAKQAARSGADLTGRLLSFSRKQTLQPVAVDVNRLVSDLQPMLQRTLGDRLTIELRLSPDEPQIYADIGALQSALLNLVLNARDASSFGSNLTISTESGSGGTVILRVIDRGSGIPDSIINRVTEPFFTTKGVGEGSGLGLSMVYGFMQQSQGEMVLESREGEGTVVSLQFPAYDPATAGGGEGRRSGQRHSVNGVRVLVVEDDDMVREMTARMLESLGNRVVVVASGRMALMRIAESPGFDLILSDVVMPDGMTGVELAHHIRGEGIQIPIILCSGYADSVFGSSTQETAAFEFLPKPFTLDQLQEKIDLVLSQGAP